MNKVFHKTIIIFSYLIVFLLSLFFITTPTRACACGMLISEGDKSIAMKGEQGIVVFDGSTQTEQMVIDFQLSGTSNNSALVVPTPVKSEISQVKKEIFTDMHWLIAPRVTMGALSVNSGSDTKAVEVLERKIVGNFEIATLKTNSYDDLVNWTTDNGFNLEPEAEGPVSAYIDNGFILNVIKLKKDAVDSDINPLLFTFASSRYFYPLMEIRDNRDTYKDKSLALYLITDKKITVPYADVENKEISKSTFDKEVRKTSDADFSNLDFTSDKYFATYITSDDYSMDTSLSLVLGNSSNSEEFAATNFSKPVEKKPEVSYLGYIAIGIIVIATAGIVMYFFWKKKQLKMIDNSSVTTEPTNAPISVDEPKPTEIIESTDEQIEQ